MNCKITILWKFIIFKYYDSKFKRLLVFLKNKYFCYFLEILTRHYFVVSSRMSYSRQMLPLNMESGMDLQQHHTAFFAALLQFAENIRKTWFLSVFQLICINKVFEKKKKKISWLLFLTLNLKPSSFNQISHINFPTY